MAEESAPGQADPGFKQPQRIEATWVGARANLPYYQRQAAQLARVLQGVSWILAGGGNQSESYPASAISGIF